MMAIRIIESNEYTERFQALDDAGNVIYEVTGTADGPPLTQAEKEFNWIAGEMTFLGAQTIEEAQERVRKNLEADPGYYDQFDWA